VISRFRDRRGAEALQKALERHQRLLAQGATPGEARARMAPKLPEETERLFSLATGLSEAATPAPQPEFADAFAARLRSIQVVRRPRPAARRSLPAFGMRFGLAAAAASIAIFAGLLVPAFRSLPGDPLYGLKRASESARVSVVSGDTEAKLRITLAAHRFKEVEGLVERSRAREMGPGLAAAGLTDIAEEITDLRVAELIRSTLQEAEEQIQVAVDILVAHPRQNSQALNDLVEIARQGRQLAVEVVGDLPPPKQSPVLNTVASLAKIEAQAEQAQMEAQTQEQPEPQPCATPTPTPSGSPGSTGDATEPSASSEARSTPSSTPCESPSPSPSSSPTNEPAPETSSEPSPPPAQQGSGESSEGQQTSNAQQGSTPSPYEQYFNQYQERYS
jgi:hypothetical protein